MPLDWQQPSSSKSKNLIPSFTDITRPIIDLQNLWVPYYKIKILDLVDVATGLQIPLFGSEQDRNFEQIEIHPVEVGHCIVFANPGPPGRQLPAISLSDITDIKSATQKEGLLRKKNVILEILFIGKENKIFRVRIDVEDRYALEIIKTIQKLKQLELDRYYWAYRSLNLKDSSNKIVGIYPNTPFLYDGEDIVWKNYRYYEGTFKDKIQFIEVVTNYRILQYDYSEHKGAGILLPLLEDVKVSNIKNKSDKNRKSSYSLLAPYVISIASAPS